ncbi:MAG TPA: murein biosynthesis integral membrane protein MurJ [Longimicrobiaceae bacterium]|nr:murein biosynthesis integral membrane protein MurJ [Longimicrobiaceae bacterium]
MTPDFTPAPAQEDETLVMPAPVAPQKVRSGGTASSTVAAGILLSRIFGLVRERVLAQYFGTSLYGDVFRAGIRMPNVLQNLLGEGTLSASFIPVYAELLEQGKKEEAGRVAGTVFSLLMTVAGALALFGIVFAPVMTDLFLPGFEGERRALTIEITRIIFPMAGTLVLSAWALGILNSHRNFFIPYFAPVLWNVAIIASLYLFGGALSPDRLVVAAAWGAFVGGLLQFGIQLPWVLRLERKLRISWDTRLEPVREAVRNAGPAIMGRGVVQLSGYVDMVLASFLVAGSVATLGFAMTLYMLPVSLFGMSVATAELPELARKRLGTEVLRERTSGALQRIAFYVVPSSVAFVALGDSIVAALYESGEFDRSDTLWVYVTLVGYALGLLASTGARLFSSTYFALRDTRTPARYAAVRVAISAVLGLLLMLQFEGIAAGPVRIPAGIFSEARVAGHTLGVFGLTLGTGIAAWVEWWLLRRALRRRIGAVGASTGAVARMFLAAGVAAAAGWGVRWLLPELHPLLAAVFIFGAYGTVYFAAAAALRIREMEGVRTRLAGLLRRFR